MAVVEKRDVIIIGSGPAGYTASIYAARAGLRPMLFEGTDLGGALMGTSDVENFPGFPEPVLGPELMGRMRKQAEATGVELKLEDVTKVDVRSDPKTVETATGRYAADAVILATGAQARTLGLDAESWATGNGLSTCATCDGFFFKGKRVAVVGGGDAAVEEAITLSRLATEVTLIHRRDVLTASSVLQDRLHESGVAIHLNAVVTDLHGDGEVSGLTIQDTQSSETARMDLEGLFVAIGQIPRSSLVEGQIDLETSGHVRVTGATQTSVPGVFACGDLVDAKYRQAITSAASGCQAALDAEHWLMTRGAISAGAISASVG